MKHLRRLGRTGAQRSPFRAILGNTAMLVGGRSVTGVLSIVYVALAARSLGVEGFGFLTLIHAYAQTVGDFAEFNSWQAVLHYGIRPLRDGRIADLYRVIRFALLLDVLGAVGGTAVALLAAFLFAGPLGLPPDLLGPAMLYATSVLFMSSTTPIGVLRLLDRFDLVAVQTTISSVTRLVGSLVVFFLGGGLGAWLAVWYVSTLAAFLFLVGAAMAVMRRRPRGERDGGEPFLAWADLRPFTKDMPGAWAFVWNINISTSLGLVTGRVAVLSVGFFLGARDAAFFRIAKQLADGATRPAKLLVPSLYPELARLWLERDLKRLRRLCLQIAATAGLVATGALLVLAIFGGPLIEFAVGPDFLGATRIMLWLFGTSVITIWALPLEPLLISTGRSGHALRVRAVVAVVYLAVLFPLMDRIGLAGAGIAALLAAALQMGLQLLAVTRARPGGTAAAAPAPEELALPSAQTLGNGPVIRGSGEPPDRMNQQQQFQAEPRRSAPEAKALTDALEAAAATGAGFNFHSGKGTLVESLPYARLRDEAKDLGRRLLALGLEPGDRVAILAETDGDFPRAFFACRYAGLVPAPMPLPAAFGGRETYLDHLRRMIAVADARAALGPAALRSWLTDAADGLDLSFAGTLADLPEGSGGDAGLPPAAGANDLCYLQFSSGSTRFPMGVAVTESSLAANAEAIIRHGLQGRDGDRCVSWLPFYHDMGLVGFVLVPVFAAVPVDFLATRDFARRPLLWLDIISRNGGTVSYAPSFGYDLCVRRLGAALPEGLDLSSWRGAGIGGDMVRPEILDRFARSFAPAGFRRQSFVASYGMAETVVGLSVAPLDTGIRAERLDLRRLETEGAAVEAASGAEARAFVLCGPALPGYALEARGDDGAALPDGRVGRIFARGPSMMEGYYRDAVATEEVLSPDGWLDTGDLGYFRNGEIVITGRAKDLIIVNGRNIWPQDLELTAEAEVEGLRSGDVAAFSVDSGGAERVVVLVECRLGDGPARARLSEAVEKTLRSRHGIEVEVALVKPNALPLTSSGKLSRTRAREMYRRMRDEGPPASPPVD